MAANVEKLALRRPGKNVPLPLLGGLSSCDLVKEYDKSSQSYRMSLSMWDTHSVT